MSQWQAAARTLWRTRSIRATRALHTPRSGRADIQMAGFPGSLRLRTGTTDAQFLRALANGWGLSEYDVPVEIRPRTILDIGANIGAVSILLKRRYPYAQIFAFEPLPENYELLAHNVTVYPGIRAIPYGLGSRTQQCTYTRSDDPTNYGGGGFHYAGPSANHPTCTLPVLATSEALEKYAITDIDLIKIDAEGAEYDVLTSLPEPVIRRVQVIVGELHGDQRELLRHLERWFAVTPVERGGAVKYFRAINHTISS